MHDRVYPEATVLPLLVYKTIRSQDFETVMHLMRFGGWCYLEFVCVGGRGGDTYSL